MTYITTEDNEDNSRTGNPDGDMGGASPGCIYETDAIAPIEFYIDVTGPLPTDRAVLTLYVWDVDEDGGPPPELDEVYFNGHLVGTLTGDDQTWSTSAFNLEDLSYVQSGNNLVEIQIDRYPGSEDNWCVGVDWGQLIIDIPLGKARFSSVTHDECVGSTFDVVFAIDVEEAGNFRLETNLLDPDNITVDSDIHEFSASSPGTVNYTAGFAPEATVRSGTYKVNANLFDADSFLQQDVRIFNVEGCPSATPEASTLILLGSAASGLAGYIGLQLRARRRKQTPNS